jgi:hypothetical protein
MIQDGNGVPVAAEAGVNVTPGNVITVSLADTTSVTSWSLSILGVDGAAIAAAPPITMQANFTATLTAPVAGSTLVFRSIVNEGVGRSTFSTYTLDAQNRRVPAARGSFGVDGVFNVRDFGAKGDGTTPDDAAFLACQAAISDQFLTRERGAIFFVPPAEPGQAYYLENDFPMLLPCRYQGVGTGSGAGGSQIKFAPGKGFRIHRFQSSPLLVGDSSFCLISGLDVASQAPPGLSRWQPNRPGGYAVGDNIRVRSNHGLDEAGMGNGEYIVHYECISAGTSTSGPEPDFWGNGVQYPDTSQPWSAGLQVKYGTLVRSSDPSHYDVFFTCVSPTYVIGTALTGSTEPGWDYTIGNIIDDANGIQWKCVSSAANIVRDGGPGGAVFSCRSAAAFLAYTSCHIDQCTVVGCLGAAIHIVGNVGSYPVSGSSVSKVSNCNITIPNRVSDPDGGYWSGVGLAIYGGDANACIFTGNLVTGGATVALGRPFRQNNHVYALGDRVQPTAAVGSQRFINFKCTNAGNGPSGNTEPDWNYKLGTTTSDGANGVVWTAIPGIPEYGYYDRGFLGNRHFGSFSQECSGPGFALISGAGSGGTYGCYSENYVPDVYVGWNGLYGGNATGGTRVVGGAFSFASQGGINIREIVSPPDVQKEVSAFIVANGGGYGQVYGFVATEDNYYHAMQYGFPIPGWWGMLHANNRLIYGISGSQALEGPASFWLPGGAFFGNNGSNRPNYFVFPDEGALENFLVRGGLRKAGDRYAPNLSAVGSPAEMIVMTDGYEGPTWRPETPYAENVAIGTLGARPAQVVRPTTSGNTNRYQCVRNGTAGATEPNWALAPNVGDEIDDPDQGGCRWRNVGVAPSYAGAGVLETRKTYFGTEPPHSGTWSQGDIGWHTAPKAGGAPGWICVASGNPGKWKAMALLAR